MNQNARKSAWHFMLLYLAFLIYSGTTVFSKLAAKQDGITVSFLLFLGLEIVCLGIYAIIWQQVLKNMSLVTAMANKGVVVIFGLLWSVLLFQENIDLCNLLGSALIIFGIWMVSTDE